MINKEIMVNDIQIKDSENIFSVKIKDDTESMIAAHNSSENAHKNVIGSLIQKTQVLSSIVNEIEDNIVLSSEIPAKLSDLENDMKFVSEETLISALEKRNMVTLAELNEKFEENNNTIKDLIGINSNTLTNKIETVKNELTERCSPETISALIQPSDKSIYLTTLTQQFQNFTMPADGMLYFQGKGYSGGASWIRLSRSSNKNLFNQANIATPGNFGTIYMMVSKGEIIEATYSYCEPTGLVFTYNNAYKPEEESGEE